MTNIHEQRMEQGYTQAEVARMVGISQAQYSRIESGKSDPPLSLVIKICKRLGMTIEMRPRTADDVNKDFKL